MKPSFKLIIIFLLVFPNILRADWERDFLTYLHSLEGERLENEYSFSIFSGYKKCSNDYLTKSLYLPNEQFFAPVLNLGVEYGFLRYNNNKKLQNYYLLSGENIYLANSSSHLKPENWKFDGLTMDSWNFGLSTLSGIGKHLTKDLNLELFHQTTFVWNRIDLEQFFPYSIYDEGIQQFDEKWKFGIDYSLIVRIPVTSYLSADIQYQRDLIYPDFHFGKWFGSFLIENGIQRWSDLFDNSFFEKIGPNYYIYKFIYNTLISYIFSEIKKGQSFAPFSSQASLGMQSYNIRFTFVPSNN